MKLWRTSIPRVGTNIPRIVNGIGRWPVLIAAVSLAVLTLELSWRHPLDERVERVHFSAGEPPARNAQPLQPLSAFEGVADRPLFTPDRRPYEPPVIAPAAPQAPRPAPVARTLRFTLNAVIKTPSAEIALLRTEGSAQVKKLAVGESYEGWTLVEVRPNAVVLRNGGDVRTIELSENAKTRS